MPVAKYMVMNYSTIMATEIEGLEIFHWQQRMIDTLRIYRQKYHYVGHPGHEYTVVFSLFQELNRLESPGNRHIFWYAAIPVLMESFRRFLYQGCLPESYPLTGGEDERTGSKLVKQNASPMEEPPYLWSLENYIKGIVALGIVRSTKLPVPEAYDHFLLKRILAQIRVLLEEMPRHLDSTGMEIPLILTVKEGTDNVSKLLSESDHPLKHELTRIKTSSTYRGTIHRRYHQLNEVEIKAVTNLDDFWNGFIP